MFDSFSTALSALSATSAGINVVGDNLANLNTTGYKSDQVSFKDMVAQSLGGGNNTQIGLGVAAPTVSRQFTQGSIQNTGGPLDAAIQGGGFFVLRDQNNQSLYSRDGSFKLDANGNLLSNSGLQVQGWMASNGVVNPTGAPTNITVQVGALQPPVATTQMNLQMNLDAGAAAKSTFAQPIQVVDSLGKTHMLTVTFTNTGSNAWDYQVTIPGDDVGTASTGTGSAATSTPQKVGNGSLKFDSSGNLTSPAAPTGGKIAVTGLADGAADMNIAWNLYDAKGNPQVTQYAQQSALSGSTQDGSQASQLTGVALDGSGSVVASFSDGRKQPIAELALASISNPDSLLAMGDNNFSISSNTATPAIGAPSTGSRGKIVGGSLEASTVDLAHEFTNLMVLQRSYEGNAKVINVSDQLAQATLNIKQ